jgi:hypothetical protein
MPDIYDQFLKSPSQPESDSREVATVSVPNPEELYTLLESEMAMVAQTRKAHPQYNPETGRIEIKSVSHMHEAIMNWMLLNPGLPMKYCASEFGVTQAWLSTLKNSGLFKSRLAEKQSELDARVYDHASDLESKLAGVAEMGVERLGEMIEQSKDPKFVLDTTDKVLNRLGYGSKQGVAPKAGTIENQNNFYVTSSAELAQARDKMRRSREDKVIEMEVTRKLEGTSGT